MIEQEIVVFKEWVATLGVVPVISALRQKAHRIQTETMESIENKMPNLTEREKKVLSKHTKSIVNQLLKEPILQAKELAMDSKAAEKLELFQQIFGIDEDVVKEKEMLAKQAKERLKVRAERHADGTTGFDILNVCQRGVSASSVIHYRCGNASISSWKGREVIMADMTMARLHEVMVVLMQLVLFFILSII